MRFVLFPLALSLAAPVLAEEWKLRAGDAPLSPSETAALINDAELQFYDDGTSKYYPDGRYSYTYASGDAAYGYYEIQADGSVCIRYLNGFERCDLYVRTGERLILITQEGDRFPVRP